MMTGHKCSNNRRFFFSLANDPNPCQFDVHSWISHLTLDLLILYLPTT